MLALMTSLDTQINFSRISYYFLQGYSTVVECKLYSLLTDIEDSELVFQRVCKLDFMNNLILFDSVILTQVWMKEYYKKAILSNFASVSAQVLNLKETEGRALTEH